MPRGLFCLRYRKDMITISRRQDDDSEDVESLKSKQGKISTKLLLVRGEPRNGATLPKEDLQRLEKSTRDNYEPM